MSGCTTRSSAWPVSACESGAAARKRRILGGAQVDALGAVAAIEQIDGAARPWEAQSNFAESFGRDQIGTGAFRAWPHTILAETFGGDLPRSRTVSLVS